VSISLEQCDEPQLSGWAPRRNRIPKGQGPDSKRDAQDRYDFTAGHFYAVALELDHMAPSSALLFAICKAIREKCSTTGRTLRHMNRWAKRRIANAYAWLDKNRDVIPDDLFRECFLAQKNILGIK
jgi:hypothetical protein